MTPTKQHPVRILAQVERLYGLHLGTPVKVRFQVAYRDKIEVRFDTLMHGILSRYSSTWRLWQQPRIVKTWHTSDGNAGGITTSIIEVVVAVWEPPLVAANAGSKQLAADDQTPPDGSPTSKPTPSDLLNRSATYPGTPVTQGSVSSPESAAAVNSHRSPVPLASSSPPALPSQAATGPVNAAALPADTPPPRTPSPATPPPTEEDRQLLPFSLEFLYSTGEASNGEKKWNYISTPGIHFGFASLVEPKANKLDFGSLNEIPSHNNRVGIALIGIGMLLTLGGLAYMGVLCLELRRRRKMSIAPPVEVTRYRNDSVEAEEIRKHQGQSYLAKKRIAVRTFLGDATLPDQTLSDSWRDHPLHDRIVYMLAILQAAITPGRLNSFEDREVEKIMEALIADKLAANQQRAVPELNWLESSSRRLGLALSKLRHR